MTNGELALKIKAGDNSLQEQLWEQIKRFVIVQAGRYITLHAERCEQMSLELDDFIQVGYFATLEAIKIYSEESEYNFLTYMGRPLRNQFNELTGFRGLAAKSQRARKQQYAIDNSVGLEASFDSDEDGLSPADVIPDPEAEKALAQVEENDYLKKLSADLEKALGRLPKRQADCIRRHYLNDETQTYIAKTLGISVGYLQSLINTGLVSLRRCSELAEYRETQFAKAYRSGVTLFKQTGSSLTEYIVMKIDEQERKLKAYL